MERDYKKGRAQTSAGDQDMKAKALRDWEIERSACKNDSECDQKIDVRCNRKP